MKGIFLLARKLLIIILIISWAFLSWPDVNNLTPPVERVEAAVGDFAIYREATGLDAINTTVTDIDWDTTVLQNGVFTLQGNGIDIDLASSGHYLVMYSVPTIDSGGSNRSEMQSWLELAGTDLPYGSGQGYIRRSGDTEEAYNHGSAIIEASAGDDLRLQMQRTDSNSATVQRRSNLSGISLLRLDDTWNYLRSRPSVDQSFGSTTNFEDVVLATDDELDTNGFVRNASEITLKTTGHYLVTYNVRVYHDSGSIRVNDESRLVLDDVEIDGTRTSTYLRGTDGTNDGSTTFIGIIETTTDNQILKLQVRRESEVNPTTHLVLSSGTGITITKLPESAEYIRLGETVGGQNLSTTEEPITWDEELEVDSASFSHSTSVNTEIIDINKDGDYLFFHAMYASRPAGNANRETQFLQWRKNGTDYTYGSSGQFNRGDQGSYDARTSGSSAGIIAHSLTSGDYIDLTNINEAADYTSTFDADRMGLQGVNIDSLFFDRPATSQSNFRWRDDSVSLNTNSGWLAVEDSNNIGTVDKGNIYRLRIYIANVGQAIEAAARSYELQFADKGDDCAQVTVWTGVGDSANDAFAMADSSNISSDGQSTSALLANSGGYTFTTGQGRDISDTSGSIGPLVASSYTELEYSVQATTEAVNGHSYCFRVYDAANNEMIDTYLVYPELTLSASTINYNKTAMEWGTQTNVGDDGWTTIYFSGNYVDPIFLCTLQYDNNIGNESDGDADSVVCRVQNVSSGSVQVRLQEPGTLVGDIGNLTPDTIHWLVVEAGQYDNASFKMEAFSYNSSVTDGKTNGWNGEQQLLSQSYASPVVLGQVMTTNDTGHSMFWSHNGSSAPPTDTALYAGKHISEDSYLTRSDETVGVFVIEQANNTINGIPYEARLQGQTIDRIDDGHTNYTFNSTFSSTPQVAIIALAGVSGTDGPFPSLYGSTPLTTTNIYPVIMETEILDTEQSGNTEYVPYLVFQSAGNYTQTSIIPIEQDTYRFYENIDQLQPTTALGNENTTISGVADTDVIRLRLALQLGSELEADALAFKLQYGQGSDCSAVSTWNDVGDVGSGEIWRGHNNTVADGSTITASLLNSQSNTLESYEESNNSVVNPNLVPDGNRAEWDWVLQNNGASANTSYCFRMVSSDASTFAYSQYPQLTTASAGNDAPAFTTFPAESTASDSTTPTNEGADVTWTATASDTNGDNYYLIICSSNSVTAGTGGGAPSCGATTYCTSTSTADDAEANCSRTTLNGDAESNDWYGFVCDAASSNQACSSADQGSGSSGSPFEVNHDPSFSVFTSADLNQDPGQSVTWTTTASDSDTSGSADTISLYVCSTNSFTGGTCDDTILCSQTGQSSNPSCSFSIPNPSPDQSGIAAYGFVVDSHGLVSSDSAQGTNQAYSINNTAPTISAANITLYDTDGSGDLTLTTSNGETTGFYVTFIVTDSNSCQNTSAGDEIASAVVHTRLSSLDQSACDEDTEDDTDNCYANAQNGTAGACYQDTSIDACTGVNDSTVGWKCTFPLNYNAEPTVADSTQASDTWRVAVQATDDDSVASNLTDDTGSVEMGMFMSYTLTAGTPVSYGTVSPNNDSSEQTITMESRGNVGLDMELSGGNASGDGMCVSDYPTCSTDTIATAQQVFNLTSAQGWSSGTALAYSANEQELNVPKPTSSGNGSDSIYMYLRIPDGQPAGVYAGEDVIAGVTGESAAW